MDLYLSSLILGAAGLGVMALSGLGARGGGHGGHSPAGGVRGHGGHSVTHQSHGTSAAARGGSHSTHSTHSAHAGHTSNVASRTLWAIASPRFLFSFALGFGTAGLLGRPFLGGPILLAASIAGGILFERVLVSPLWNFLMKFASAPASMLESAVTDEATAVTAFDANGQGIVSVEVDGQIMQILATLRANDRLLGGARVRAGQRVRVEDVDSEKNCCTVSLI